MNSEIKKESGIVIDEDVALAAVLKRGGVDPEHLAAAVIEEMDNCERPEPLSAQSAILKPEAGMNLNQWGRLDKMATRAPENLCSIQWEQLIQFAQSEMENDEVYWQGRLSVYEAGRAQEETRLAEQLKTPAPEPKIDPVKAVREQLMAVFKVDPGGSVSTSNGLTTC